MEMRIATLAVLLLLAGCGAAEQAPRQAPPPASPPRPSEPLPRDAAGLAAALTDTTHRLRAAIDAWGGAGATPEAVTLHALFQQRIYRLIARKRALGNAVLAQLPDDVAAEARDTVRGRRELLAIPASGHLRPKIRAAEPEPADRLRAYYDRAEKRFGVGWHVLAAVNFVESGFGRLRNESTAGARGPMQFMPATWRAYGLGGDIRDPRDAILGAANYLHANGAPGSYRRALLHYNRSLHYVEAVLRFARRIRRDERAFYAYYAWQVYVRRDGRVRRITGPRG
jgi:membrane-bound lytic murein transglycosylase B